MESMRYKKILLTGGSGKLGQAIIRSGYFPPLLMPSRKVLDVTKPKTIENFFCNNDIDAVIHCAALARMGECEENPAKAIETNIIGASNIVIEIIKKENKSEKKIRFIHISTDGVYPGTEGNYSERDKTIPYDKYGWTKLGAECAVNLLSNFCIIRTSFFDPKNIKFDFSAIDAFSSKVQINYLAKAVAKMLYSDFIGVINIGDKRKSDYERYKQYKHSLKPCKLKDILKTIPFNMAKDASMNCSLWKKISKRGNNKQDG